MLLGLWLFFRFPAIGPRSLKGAFLLVACGYCLLLVCGTATRGADTLAGPAVALFCVYLPIMTFAFWAALRLLHATIVAVGGRSSA